MSTSHVRSSVINSPPHNTVDRIEKFFIYFIFVSSGAIEEVDAELRIFRMLSRERVILNCSGSSRKTVKPLWCVYKETSHKSKGWYVPRKVLEKFSIQLHHRPDEANEKYVGIFFGIYEGEKYESLVQKKCWIIKFSNGFN